MYSEEAIDRSSERLSLDQGEGHMLHVWNVWMDGRGEKVS